MIEQQPHRISRRQLFGLVGAGAAAAGATYAALEPPGGLPPSAPRVQAAHLLRRAGFAPSAAELAAATSAGTAKTLDQLLHPESVDDSALESALARQAFDFTKIPDVRRWWLTRMALTRRPLVEKMTLFWHGLLTSSYLKAGPGDLMYVQNQFLRANALGSLNGLLVGISKDGAMLRWLDGSGSNSAHPNENYARELMELFTMGVGHYGQDDVVAAARALTGWVVDKNDVVGFHPKAFDGGAKTFLGQTGPWGMPDVVRIILANPATPQYLARRMWEFFAYPDPSDGDLAPVVAAYRQTNGSVRAMLQAIFTAPGFSSPKAYRALVKSPTELIAGLARQLGLPVGPLEGAAGDSTGQALFDPPNVAGWPPGAAWMSTGQWMARARYLHARSSQPASIASVAAVAGTSTPEAGQVDALLALMVDGDLAPDARTAILSHVSSLPRRAGAAQSLFLVAASPEYQLA